MDTFDGPNMSQKFVKKKKDPLQNELQMKLQQRRKQGLAADMTSEEDDIPEDNEGGQDEEDFMAQYRVDPASQKRNNRPSSAKRRSPYSNEKSFEETLRPGGGDRFMRTADFSRGGGKGMPPLSSPKSPPSDRRSPAMPALSPKQSPKGLGDTLRPGKDQDLFLSLGQKSSSGYDKYGDKGRGDASRRSPADKSGASLPSPGRVGQQQMSKSDLIFGRKTPTNDPLRQSPTSGYDTGKQWTAPSFRKASPVQDYENRQEQSYDMPGIRGGRTTPSMDSSLQPINETPSPRPRRMSGGTTQKGRPGSGGPKIQPRVKTDIFGKSEKVEVDLSDDDENAETKGRRFQRGGRQTPTDQLRDQSGRKTPTGRATPTGRTTPTGRKTPSGTEGRRFSQSPGGRKTPSNEDYGGRKTPTNDRFGGRKSPANNYDQNARRPRIPRDEEERKPVVKKEPSLFDFLAPEDSKKDKRQEKQTKLLKDDHDSSAEEELSFSPKQSRRQQRSLLKDREEKQPVHVNGKKEKSDLWSSRNTDEQIPTDQSSVCADIERDPNFRLQDKHTLKQRQEEKKISDSTMNNDVIDVVAEEQERPASQVKHIEPSKGKNIRSKSAHQLHKPKPRHSLPGTPSSGSQTDIDFNSTMSIREAIYAQWREEKMKTAKEQLKEEKKKKKEAEEKEEQKKKDKMLENKASYQSWAEKKKETVFKEKAKERKKAEEKKYKEEKEKEQRKKEAEKNFEIWKRAKDEEKEDTVKSKKEDIISKKQEERHVKEQRLKDSESAFKGWKTKKDEQLLRTVKEKKTMQKTMKKSEEQQKAEQEEEALRRYHEWMDKKERQKAQEKQRAKNRQYGSTEDLDFRPPWSPNNKTIPFGR